MSLVTIILIGINMWEVVFFGKHNFTFITIFNSPGSGKLHAPPPNSPEQDEAPLDWYACLQSPGGIVRPRLSVDAIGVDDAGVDTFRVLPPTEKGA